MPDMDGIEAAQLMSGSDPTVPIVLFTALDLDGLENPRSQRGHLWRSFSKARGWNLLKSYRDCGSRNPHEKLRLRTQVSVCRYRTSAKRDWHTIPLACAT